MPRSAAVLSGRLRVIFRARLEDTNQIAAKIANAYQDYATSAQGIIGDRVVLLGGEHAGFRQSISALLRGNFSRTRASNAIAEGITRFWLLPPVKTGGAGVCVSIVPAAAAAKMRSVRVSSSDKAASTLADALHLMTSTIFVTYPPPQPPGFLL